MVSKTGIFVLIALAANEYCLGIPTTNLGLANQCRDILTTIRTNVKSIPADQLPSTICDIDDEELKGQCHDLFDQNGEEFLDFVDNVDINEVCDYIVTSLDEQGLIDNNLYYQSVRGATDTEDVGNYICAVCTKFMAFIHGFLSSRQHQALALHILKGACHFVPIFKTECNLLINMYGRLILNLASRYLSPKLCHTFHLCPGQLPSSCEDIRKLGVRAAQSGTYTLYNANKRPFKVHCSFQAKHITTFISTETAISINVSALFNNNKRVLIRYATTYDEQFESELSQISAYKNIPLSVQFTKNSGYATPQNKRMVPFLYLGFIPISQSRKGATQGYSVNGKDQTFKNCDGNPNSYFSFLFNHRAYKPVKYGPFDNAFMHVWEKDAKAVPVNERIPCEYFSFFEIHFGGCGGYSTTQQFPNMAGAALGLRYDIQCNEPEDIPNGTKYVQGTSVGMEVEYACNQGFYMVLGGTKRTCGSDGKWTGCTPNCMKETEEY